MNEADRRTDARLRLAYPIQVRPDADRVTRAGRRIVTQDVSARGAYFSTFDGGDYSVGQVLGIEISVPHKLAGGPHEVLLELRGRARVVRIDPPAARRVYGEDGLALTGVALHFADPLRFEYAWV